jgi:ABC-type transport system involved in cytochrome c biogenesis permease component
MFKRFLPVVSRELREASRQKATYWNRVVAASVALIIFFLFWLGLRREPAHVLGQSIFYSLSALAGIICALAGSSVADSISKEKREGTLGLLFLTNLRGYDVVTGKIAAGSLGTIYRVMAILPFAAIGFLLGGVEMDMFLRVVLLCGNTIFLSLTLAAYWSSRMTTSWASLLAWLASMFFLILGLPFLVSLLISAMRQYLEQPGDEKMFMYLMLPSPGFSTVLTVGPKQFFSQYYPFLWGSLLFQHLMGWLFFIFASQRTQRVWRQQEMQVVRIKVVRNLGDRFRQFIHWLRWRHDEVKDEAPISWLVRRSRLGLNITLLVFTIATVVFLWGLAYYPRDWKDPAVFSMTMSLTHLWLLAWMAGEAATWIYRDRNSGAMELILATPLEVKNILRDHFRGINRKLVWPVIWVVVVDFFFMFHDTTSYQGLRSNNFRFALWGCIIGMLLFNLYVLRWVSTWMGLISRNEFNAAIAGLIWLNLPTWLILGGGSFGLFLLSQVFEVRWVRDYLMDFEEWQFLGIWLLLAVLNNLVMLWLSHRECLRLREYATLRPDTTFLGQAKYIVNLFLRQPLDT